MPKTIDIPENDSLFARAVNDRMREMGMSLLNLADTMEISYEHARKLSRGLATPSPLMLKQVCTALKLDLQEMKKLVTADQIRQKFGDIPEELAGKNPALRPIERNWDYLSAEQKKMIVTTVEGLAKQNRRER